MQAEPQHDQLVNSALGSTPPRLPANCPRAARCSLIQDTAALPCSPSRSLFGKSLEPPANRIRHSLPKHREYIPRRFQARRTPPSVPRRFCPVRGRSSFSTGEISRSLARGGALHRFHSSRGRATNSPDTIAPDSSGASLPAPPTALFSTTAVGRGETR